MAKIYTPHRAIGFKEGKRTRKVPARKKYHLMKYDGNVTEEGMTVCGFIVWDDETLKELDVEDRNDVYDCPEISTLPAERLCKKCLGPLKAVD